MRVDGFVQQFHYFIGFDEEIRIFLNHKAVGMPGPDRFDLAVELQRAGVRLNPGHGYFIACRSLWRAQMQHHIIARKLGLYIRAEALKKSGTDLGPVGHAVWRAAVAERYGGVFVVGDKIFQLARGVINRALFVDPIVNERAPNGLCRRWDKKWQVVDVDTRIRV